MGKQSVGIKTWWYFVESFEFVGPIGSVWLIREDVMLWICQCSVSVRKFTLSKFSTFQNVKSL